MQRNQLLHTAPDSPLVSFHLVLPGQTDRQTDGRKDGWTDGVPCGQEATSFIFIPIHPISHRQNCTASGGEGEGVGPRPGFLPDSCQFSRDSESQRFPPRSHRGSNADRTPTQTATQTHIWINKHIPALAHSKQCVFLYFFVFLATRQMLIKCDSALDYNDKLDTKRFKLKQGTSNVSPPR